MNDDQIILQYVEQVCANKPHLLRPIIDAATAGVKRFADTQKDGLSRIAFALTEVIGNTTQEQFGAFSRADLIRFTKPCLEGTEWWKKNNPDKA